MSLDRHSPILSALVLLVSILWYWTRDRYSKGPSPPGPPSRPLFGTNVPSTMPELLYQLADWAKEYGDIYALDRGRLVILSGATAVREVIDRPGQIAAERPEYPTFDMITSCFHLQTLKDGDWQGSRRGFQMMQNTEGMARISKIVEKEIISLAYGFCRKPKDFDMHIDRASTSALLTTLYGISCPSDATPRSEEYRIFHHLHDYLHRWFSAFNPGKFRPLDYFPFLKYVPDKWMKWRREYEDLRDTQQRIYSELVKVVEDRMARGERAGCHIEDILDRPGTLGMGKSGHMWVAYYGGSMIEGAHDSAVFLKTMLLVLVLHPECQRKAWEEIEQVVGTDRMPTYSDIDKLPYTRAIIQETHRYRPAVPLVFPHRNTEDIVYKGYTIRKGSSLLINMWEIMHDPDVFEAPEDFRPERFLHSKNGAMDGARNAQNLRANLPFGAGRRICPGVSFSSTLINLSTMCFLWAFRFERELDGSGDPIPIDPFSFMGGVSTLPSKFSCKIVPRHTRNVEVIEKMYQQVLETP